MPTAVQMNYDANGRLTSTIYDTGAKVVQNYDQLGNRIAEFELPECCVVRFFILEKSGDFTANDGAGAFYIVSATATITMPASPADGGVYKFKVIGGTSNFIFNGSEQIFHADGTADQELSIGVDSGCLELVAITGGWVET